MNLFLLKIIGDGDFEDLIHTKYRDFKHYTDTYGYVIRAEGENEARAMARLGAPYEGLGPQDDGWWLDPEVTSCEVIKPEGEPEIILSDESIG